MLYLFSCTVVAMTRNEAKHLKCTNGMINALKIDFQTVPLTIRSSKETRVGFLLLVLLLKMGPSSFSSWSVQNLQTI